MVSRMNKTEFEEITGLIERGGDVSADELMDLMAYAGTAIYELRQALQKLASGYAAQQKAMARKDRKIEMANKMLTAVRAENARLRDRLSPPETASAEGRSRDA